ncbi:MAG: hypothetical protein C5B49_04505 [Bdellovibrio sp.]|nr:MAG: hypothetical protein C5B49_04505 [Bdellovibrio sp.]
MQYRPIFASTVLLFCFSMLATKAFCAKTAAKPTSFGLWDEGFRNPIVRSELGDVKEIEIGNCLYSGPCPAGVSCSPCPASPSKYASSNYFSNHKPLPERGRRSRHGFTGSFWILDHNNDTGALALSFNDCNSGPPNQSAPVAASPNEKSVFAFWTDGNKKGGARAHLALDNHFNHCAVSIPYLGLGAQKAKGNQGKEIGWFIRKSFREGDFSPDFSGIRFDAALTSCSTGSPCLFYFNVHTRWNGKARMLILTIGHLNHPGQDAKHAHWNWPAKGSVYYNGADLAYLRCENAGVPCLSASPDGKSYSLSMADLLARGSDLGLFDDPLPIGERISIEGVSWAIETAGNTSQNEGWLQGMATLPRREPHVYKFQGNRLIEDGREIPLGKGKGYLDQIETGIRSRVFSGWASDSSGALAASRILLFGDGELLASVVPGIDRPDVFSAIGPAGKSAGFAFPVAKELLVSVNHFEIVVVVESQGVRHFFTLPMTPSQLESLKSK